MTMSDQCDISLTVLLNLLRKALSCGGR